MSFSRKSIIGGSIASLSLFGIYLLFLTLLNSFEHAIQQFISLWFWMVPLIVGFGIQMMLFISLRDHIKENKASTVTIAASGGISTSSMIACCAHHITEILPLIGFSGTMIFFTKYQTLFLAIGVASTLVGISYMFKKHEELGLFSFKREIISIKKIFPVTLIIGVIIVIMGVVVSI